MELKLYNTLSRKKEIFKPLEKGKVKMYECGPTVYSYPHIGNMLRYIFGDILTRTLIFNKYEVKRVMNVTDVGHLTEDSDIGEDKMEKSAVREGKTAKQIANFYWSAFKEDFKRLNILEPDIWCKATEHIEEQINLIEKLEKRQVTYRTSDGIYFDSSKFLEYGKLSGNKQENLDAGKRITLKEKKNMSDFALWKFSFPENKRQQEWDSPWGRGFPGWHIECSAMSMKYLGETIDIHTGGVDNIFPHHENEIAQSEVATGKHFVNYWLHNGFLTFKGEKVSKSKGGLYTLGELEKKGFLPLSYRYLCLNTSYRKPLDFSMEALENAQNSFKRLKNAVSQIQEDEKINKEYLEGFTQSINDDLNSPKALAVLWELIRDENAIGKYQTIKQMDEVLGLNLFEKEELKVPSEIRDIAEERQKTRRNKDWKKSDELREILKKKGWLVKDIKEKYELDKII
jgi:cysteinyl-tRNA synthetase